MVLLRDHPARLGDLRVPCSAPDVPLAEADRVYAIRDVVDYCAVNVAGLETGIFHDVGRAVLPYCRFHPQWHSITNTPSREQSVA
jgi:hypothetical protein